MGVCPTPMSYNARTTDTHSILRMLKALHLASLRLHWGWLLRMSVFGRIYILLCSQSMQLNIFKGGFPALIMAPQPSRTLAIRWDSLGQP